MKVNGKEYRTVWMNGSSVYLIEQNLLPFEFRVVECRSYKETCKAIRNMAIRGAGAIGAAAGYAMAQAALEAPSHQKEPFLLSARKEIESTRPTARNLFYAVERVFAAAASTAAFAVTEAQAVADDDALASQKIGDFGSELIRDGSGIATHCNAGWLAFVDYGTALSPVYKSHQQGKKILVYVDETRPRSQGARLTAWELNNAGVPHFIIPDNATAWYMAQGKISLMIVGADRIAKNGDTANKIGTLEKAISARHYNIPFYIAAPTSTIDMDCSGGSHIIIEERSQEEVLYQEGMTEDGRKEKVLVCSPGSPALNPAFDVTPAGLITGFITEKGIIRNLLLLSTMFLLMVMTGFTQSFVRGSQAINLGIGFWNTAYLGNDRYSGFFPSISGSYEYGIAKIPMGSRLTGVLGAVGYAGISFTNYYSSSAGDYYLRRDILIGIGGNYHFIFHDKLDIYAGTWVGFDSRNYKWKGSGDAPEEVDFSPGNPYGGAYFGARWFFTDHIAIYSETGGLVSIVNAGVAFKF